MAGSRSQGANLEVIAEAGALVDDFALPDENRAGQCLRSLIAP